MNVRRPLITGLAGAAAMGATTALDMRLRGRSASAVPARALAAVPGLEGFARRHEAAVSWAALPVTALAAGALRERVRNPVGYAALISLPDLVLPSAVAGHPPPWRWPAAELALSAAHHVAFAAAAELAYRLVGSDCSSAATGANRSPCSATRSSTSADVNARS